MMNPDWRTLWDVAMDERERRNARLERKRVLRDAGVTPVSVLAPICIKLGGVLIAAGQRLASEPGGYRSHAPNAI